MSRAQLRACALDRQAMIEFAAKIADADEGLKARQLKLTEASAGLEVERRAVDFNDIPAVDAFNRHMIAVQQAGIAINADTTTRNAAMGKLNAHTLAHDAACAHRPYLKADFAALPAELQRIMLRPGRFSPSRR